MEILKPRPWEGFNVIPLVVLDEAVRILPVMDALLAGGLEIIEVGLRSSCALEALSLAVAARKMVVAAGTVRTSEQVYWAADSGADFAVSPCSTESVLESSINIGLPLIPSVATVTEAQRTLDRGFFDLKIYPAHSLGGPDFLRAMSAVAPEARFMPAGGIDEGNLHRFISKTNVFSVSGSWIASRELINSGDYAEISRRAKTALKIIREHG